MININHEYQPPLDDLEDLNLPKKELTLEQEINLTKIQKQIQQKEAEIHKLKMLEMLEFAPNEESREKILGLIEKVDQILESYKE